MPSLEYLRSIKFRNKKMLLPFVLILAVSFLSGTQGYSSCPMVCTCKWKGGKETAECIDRKLITIPENIEPGTQVLDMSDNNLQILPSEAFKRVDLLNLQKIYLRSCHLGQIDSAAFDGLTNLVELDLSHNLLTNVPTTALNALPSLRDFILASNPIQKIESQAFAPVPQLVKLDVSHCDIQQIAPLAFDGLDMLHTLKLNGNKLNILQAATIQSLSRLRGIELHDNPWVCDCRMRAVKIWLHDHNIPLPVAPVCYAGPERVIERTFSDLAVDDFACKPDMIPVSRIIEATTGENASITCRSHAIPSAKISWFLNGRPLVNNSAHSAYQRVHIYEEGTFEKRSRLILTNAQETDNNDFYCVAENAAGTAEANFTLHVSLRAAGVRLGEKQIAGLSAALVILILFILLITAFLLVRLRRIPLSESKTPGQLEVVTSVNTATIPNGKIVSPVTEAPERKNSDPSKMNPIQKHPRLTDLPYSTNNYDGSGSVIAPTAAFGSPTAQANPDLINDTRGGGGSGSNLAEASTSNTTSTAATSTVQMANLLAEMQHLDSGDYRGCDSLYPSGLWDGSNGGVIGSSVNGGGGTTPNMTNLLLEAHRYSAVAAAKAAAAAGTYHNSNLTLDDETVMSDYQLSRTFPRSTHLSNNNSLTNSYQPNLSHSVVGNFGGTNGGGSGYPTDYGLPIVPGAEHQLHTAKLGHTGSVSIPNITNNNTTGAPINAKTLRVWQKGGVPVLPPVTALKRALSNSRNSPDEGYQEGCGTDV